MRRVLTPFDAKSSKVQPEKQNLRLRKITRHGRRHPYTIENWYGRSFGSARLGLVFSGEAEQTHTDLGDLHKVRKNPFFGYIIEPQGTTNFEEFLKSPQFENYGVLKLW